MYLGLRAVIAKSFARIHRANLINFGIIPLLFKDPADYDRLSVEDSLKIKDIKKALSDGEKEVSVENLSKGYSFKVRLEFNERERSLLLKGGLLAWIKDKR